MIHAFIIGLIIFSFGLFWRGDFPKWAYYSAFLVKAIATIITGYYYVEVLQAGDSLSYFWEAMGFNQQYLTSLASYLSALIYADIPSQSSNWHSVFFIKCISPIVWLSGGNYWMTALYLTLINFLACWYAVTSFTRTLNSQWLAYIACFCLPGVILWSGGIFKEAIANAVLLITIALIIEIFQEFRQKDWPKTVIGLLCLTILIQLRFYLGGIAILFLLGYSWLSLKSISKNIQWIGVIVLLIVCFFGAQLFHPWLRPSRLPLTLFENYQQIRVNSSPENLISFGTFSPSYKGLFITLPQAWFTGFFRPFLFENTQWLLLAFQLEKLLLFVLACWSVIKIKTDMPTKLAVVSFISLSILATAIALATPNYGSLLRYQSAYLPFLFLLFGWLPYRKVIPPS